MLFLIALIQLSEHDALAQADVEERAKTLFSEAEAYFFTDTPTPESDQKAIDFYKEVINIYAASGNTALIQADSYQRLASIQLGRGNFSEAKTGYHRALSLKQDMGQVGDSVYFQELIYLGDAHFLTDRPDSAEWYYTQAQKITNQYPEVYDVERIYNSLGAFYFQTGNYIQAINYYQKALSLLQEDNPDYDEAIVSFTYNMANAQLKMAQYEEAIQSYRKLLTYGIFSEYIYLNMGLAFIQTLEYDSADYYLAKTKNSQSPKLKLSSTNALGHLSLERGNLDTATSFFREAIARNDSLYSFRNRLLSKSYLGLGQALLKQGQFGEAQLQFQSALENNILSNNDTTASSPVVGFNQVISPLDQFTALQGLGESYRLLYNISKEEGSLRKALASFRQASHTARYIQKTYDNDGAKLFLIQKVYPLYEQAISTAHHLYQLTGNLAFAYQAFQFSEKSKAAVLSEVLNELEIKSTAPLSDSLIQEERNWKQKITQARLRMVESQDAAMTDRLQKQLIDYEIGLARTVKSLEKDEKYYRLKYQTDSVDIVALQQNLLTQKDAMFEYFMGNDSLYTFILTRDQFMTKAVPIDEKFTSALNEVRASIYGYSMGQAYDQSQNAFQLYQKLIQPFESVLRSKERLIIVPDGPLSYLPLEMLNSDSISNRYLIHDYTFSYAYSANLLKEAVNQQRDQDTGSILAMAPFAGDEEGNIRSNGFSLLFSSKEEVENIGGSIYLEDKATKRLFLELAGKYGVLHLATHASISNNDPLDSFIAFFPDQDSSSVGYRLYTHELYNLELDSVKLVVLSACEAGNGKLVKGEGIISLARAFAYAGCPNIVTTLWKALDKSTASIATGLHTYLKEGYTKDEALRRAKLDYLKAKDVHPLMKTPYHWANFIFIGDPAPIYEPFSVLWWWGLAFVIFIALGYWLLKKSAFHTKKA